MIMQVFSIRDVRTGFLAPVCETNEGTAVRNFEHAVLNNNDSLFFSHPEDYALFHIGSFDTDNGHFAPELAEQVISAAEIMRKAFSVKNEVKHDGE